MQNGAKFPISNKCENSTKETAKKWDSWYFNGWNLNGKDVDTISL